MHSYLQCKSFVETYAPQVIQLLENEIDPKSICKVWLQFEYEHVSIEGFFLVSVSIHDFLKTLSFQALKFCDSALMKPWTKLSRARVL